MYQTQPSNIEATIRVISKVAFLKIIKNAFLKTVPWAHLSLTWKQLCIWDFFRMFKNSYSQKDLWEKAFVLFAEALPKITINKVILKILENNSSERFLFGSVKVVIM